MTAPIRRNGRLHADRPLAQGARRPTSSSSAPMPTTPSASCARCTRSALPRRIFGGAMVGPQIGSLKAQLGEELNGLVTYDLYVPEPTMEFPGHSRSCQVPGARRAGREPICSASTSRPSPMRRSRSWPGGRGRGQPRSGKAGALYARGDLPHHRRRREVRAGRRMGRSRACSPSSTRTFTATTSSSSRSRESR